MGGVVTSVQSSGGYSVPYLVYSSNSNVFSHINNGTALLIDGSGLELLNVSNMQSALYSGYYYNSSFAPSYLDWAQGNSSKKSQTGLYSFNLYNRPVPIFSSTGINTINANQVFTPVGNKQNFTVSLWFDPNNIISSYSGGVLAKQGFFNLNLTSSKVVFGSACGGTVNSISLNGIILPNTWHNVVAVYNSISSHVQRVHIS